MRFNNVGQLCTILSFASWVERGYGSRIYPRSDIISTSSTISSSSSSKSSTSSSSVHSATSSSSSVSSSLSSSSISSSSSSSSIQIITESVIPIKLSTTSPSSSVSPTSTEVKSPSSASTKSTSISAASSTSSSAISLSSAATSSTALPAALPAAEKPKAAELVSTGNQASSLTSVSKSAISIASTGNPTSVSKSATTKKESVSGEKSTGNAASTASVKPIPNNASPSSTLKGASTKVSYSPWSTITTGPKYDSQAKWGVFPWGNHPAWGGYPWGNSTIPSNTCWHEDSQDNPWWPGCTISAWQVRLSYFPKPSGTLRYPTTYFEPKLKITMTSPSIYMVLETVAASNACGQLGPQFTNYPLALNPSEVSTLQLFHDFAAHSMIGAPQVLDLDDIATDCEDAAFEGRTLTKGTHWTTHPVAGDDFNRCSPRIAWPTQLKSLGYKYWEHCTKLNEDYGLFDPPGAVPPLSSGAGLLPSPSPTPAVKVVATPTPAAPVQNPAPIQPSNTSPPQPAAPTPVANTPAQQPSNPVAQPSQPSNVANPPSNQPAPVIQPSNQAAPVVQPSNPAGQPSNPVAQPINPGNNNQNGPGPTPAPPTPSNAPQAPPPSVVAVVGGQTISAQADSPNIILPNGSTANVGTVATIINPDNNKPPVVVSVAPSGVYVVSGGDGSTPNNFYANPVVINQGAPTPVANVEQTPKPIATIGGEVVNAIPGASTVVIKGQTLTAGGAPMTISGTDIVAILGSQGLTVQSAGGAVSSYALPTPASPASPGITTTAIIGTINGNVITAAPGASSVVVGSETLKMGGPPITLSNNEVISLGSSGIIVQAPGGIVKTLPLSTVSDSKSAMGTADLIASIIGVTKTGGETPPSTTSGLSTQPPNISKSSSSSVRSSAPLSSLVTSSIASQASASSQLNITSSSNSRSIAISIVTDSGSPSKVSPAIATVIKSPTAASTSAKSSASSHLHSSTLIVMMSALLGGLVGLM